MTTKQVALPPSSLIICTRNRPALLRETLGFVLQGNALPNELIVIDQSDAANDEIAQLAATLRQVELRYFPSRSIGPACARNLAVAQARYDLLAFLDDDMQVPEDWYALLLKALVAGGAQTIITGRVMPFADRPDGFVPSTITSLLPQSYAGRMRKDPLFSGHMALYRSAMAQIGPFDERLGPGTPFPAAEDNDFGYRALQAGFVIQYAPEAVVYHRAWRHKRDYWALRWAYGRGQGGYYAKYFSRKDSFMVRRMGSELIGRIVKWPIRLFTKPWWVASDLVYSCALLSGAAEWVLRYGRK